MRYILSLFRPRHLIQCYCFRVRRKRHLPSKKQKNKQNQATDKKASDKRNSTAQQKKIDLSKRTIVRGRKTSTATKRMLSMSPGATNYIDACHIWICHPFVFFRCKSTANLTLHSQFAIELFVGTATTVKDKAVI